MLPPAVAAKLETAVDLARTHLIEARRSVGALRPNVGDGEDVAHGAQAARRSRAADAPACRSTSSSTSCRVSATASSGRFIGIAQEALTNAVRHSRAQPHHDARFDACDRLASGCRSPTMAAGSRGERLASGFGMTSMQERAERIGASLTIVTAPRNGTEVVLAWEPSSLPTQVHFAS